jgi:hypothetical protein
VSGGIESGDLYLLFFIDVGSRRVHLTGRTHRPSGAWVVEQTRTLSWKREEGERPARFLLPGPGLKSKAVGVIHLPFFRPSVCVCGRRTGLAVVALQRTRTSS